MPTTIPDRIVDSDSRSGLLGLCRALLPFYVAIACALFLLAAIEMHFGIYPGLAAMLGADESDVFASDLDRPVQLTDAGKTAAKISAASAPNQLSP